MRGLDSDCLIWLVGSARKLLLNGLFSSDLRSKCLSETCSGTEYPCGFPSCRWLRWRVLSELGCGFMSVSARIMDFGGGLDLSRFVWSGRRTGALPVAGVLVGFLLSLIVVKIVYSFNFKAILPN